MSNSFKFDVNKQEEDRASLVNIANGAVLPNEMADKLLAARENGENEINEFVHVPNFGGLSGSEDRGGGDNSIQFINFGRVGDKSFKEWRQKLGGWKGG